MPPKPTLQLLDFIATEATHDSFYNMVDLIDQNKGGIDLKGLIDELGKKCSLKETKTPNTTLNVPFNNTPTKLPSKVFKNSYFANNVGITEFKMDEVLLGEKRHVLCSIYKNTWHIIQVPSIDYFTMKVSKINAEIQHFTDIACNFSDTIMINTMFSKVNRNSNVRDIYFVCDSASELIGKFSKTRYFPNDINVHVMISSSTLADPSSRITQSSRHPKSKPQQGNKYIHTYNEPIDLKKCDKFGLLDFNITHRLHGPRPNYLVDETFEYSEKGLATGQKGAVSEPYPSKRSLNPSNEATGKKVLQCEIGKGGLNKNQCGKIDGKPAKQPFYMDMIRGLRIAQYKRMGDHQQIRFIRWLWDRTNFVKSQTLYHSNNGQEISPANLNSFTSPNPTNCFFVTGDYPAFEYAIFHRINAIIKTSASNGSKRGLLMVRFN